MKKLLLLLPLLTSCAGDAMKPTRTQVRGGLVMSFHSTDWNCGSFELHLSTEGWSYIKTWPQWTNVGQWLPNENGVTVTGTVTTQFHYNEKFNSLYTVPDRFICIQDV